MKRGSVTVVAFSLALALGVAALTLSIDESADVSGSWFAVLWGAFGAALLTGLLSLNGVYDRMRAAPSNARPLVRRRRQEPTVERSEVALPESNPLEGRIEQELVAILDEGLALGPDAFRPPQFGPYSWWRDQATDFIETVFGATERQRFNEPYEPPPTTLARNVEDHVRRLRDLRDRRETWRLQVNAEGLRKAINERREPPPFPPKPSQSTAEQPQHPTPEPQASSTGQERLTGLARALEAFSKGTQRDLEDRFARLYEEGVRLRQQRAKPPLECYDLVCEWVGMARQAISQEIPRFVVEFDSGQQVPPRRLDETFDLQAQLDELLAEKVAYIGRIVTELRSGH